MCIKCTVLRLLWRTLLSQRGTVAARVLEADPDTIITTTPVLTVIIPTPIATILVFVNNSRTHFVLTELTT